MAKSKVNQQINKACKSGMSPVDVYRLRESARKYTNERIDEIRAELRAEVEKEVLEQARREAFLCSLAVPLNVLVNDYWAKSAKKRAPQFIEDVLSLYKSVEAGAVTDDDLKKLLSDYAGITLDSNA